MSVGPLNLGSSMAGSPLAQLHGSDVERTQQEAGAQQRRVFTDQKTEAAAGVGEADGEDHESSDRDADGRRPWEAPPDQPPVAAQGEPDPAPRVKDTTGQSGNLLDLSG